MKLPPLPPAADRYRVEGFLIERYGRGQMYEFALDVAEAVRAECVRICDEHEQYPSLTPRHCADAIKSLEIEP